MNFFSLWHSQIQHQFLLLKKDIKEVVVFTQIHFFQENTKDNVLSGENKSPENKSLSICVVNIFCFIFQTNMKSRRRIWRALASRGSWTLARIVMLATTILVISQSFPVALAHVTHRDLSEKELLNLLGIQKPQSDERPGGRISAYMQQLYKDRQIFQIGSAYNNGDDITTRRPYSNPPDTVRSIANITEVG